MQQSEDVSKLQAQFSTVKSYVMCEISTLVQKIGQILESVNTIFSNLKQNDNRNTIMLEPWFLKPFQNKINLRKQIKISIMFYGITIQRSNT